MILPTPRAILIMFLGIPVFVLVGILAPTYWAASAVWIAVVFGFMFIDLLLGGRIDQLKAECAPPGRLFIDGEEPLEVRFWFARGARPRWIDVRPELNALLSDPGTRRIDVGAAEGMSCNFPLTPKRRGTGRLIWLWFKWTGPLGLIQKQKKFGYDEEIPIVPNIKWVSEEAVRLYTRDAEFGIKMQIDRGDGSEFDALREFTTGMDRRAIDWKQSARHNTLLAKEFRTERNHNIVFAFDSSRLMSEPLGGVPKIDRALNAGLLLAFVSLKSGDKTAIFSFDSQPKVTSSLMTGRGAFGLVQMLASRVDYSTEEANYTLALTELAGRLDRRSLVILFTDFVDSISGEMMLETVKRLTDRHLVLFVTFEDKALTGYVRRSPDETEDVSRAVIAGSLLTEREVVFNRLRRLGAQVLETTPEKFGSELLSRYLDIKRRELL